MPASLARKRALRSKADAVRRIALPLSVDARANAAGVRFDRTAIESLVGRLAIKQPLTFRWDASLVAQVGVHAWNGRDHRISIADNATLYEVRRSAVHELVHALQAEACASSEDWRAAYRGEDDRRGYDLNRYEVEARAIAKEFANDFALAR